MIWIIHVSLLLCQSGFSTVRTVLNWVLGIFYQQSFWCWEKNPSIWHQARSQICFCPRHLFGKKEYIYPPAPGNYHLNISGQSEHWVILFLDRVFECHLLKACFHLVLAGTQHPLFLRNSFFFFFFDHDTRRNLWGDKDPLGPSACRCSPWAAPSCCQCAGSHWYHNLSTATHPALRQLLW